jgi:D-serine deaminase-like pyridoxal phosphate-dependent protein
MSPEQPPVLVPRMRSEIPTPALLVDVPALERNIARMAAYFSSGPCRLRPHLKAHKTLEIARRQLAAGGCIGLTCATVSEAEAAASFCEDLLIANEIVDPGKCARVAGLAARTRVTVAVDSRSGVQAIGAAAVRAGVRVGVLVDLDVGQGRCGVEPGPAALDLARHVATTAGLTLRGLMGYEGHLQAVRERQERERLTRLAMQELVATAALVRGAGLPCEVVSAGGTGTHDISGHVDGVTEIQAGSYVLMDSDYAAVGVGYEQACVVLGTVVSRAAGRCVVDCGHKALSTDHGLPSVRGLVGARVTALNDEHATIALPADASCDVGALIEFVPSHVDPTINLHDAWFVMDGDRVVDVWPIAARGYPEHRAILAWRAARDRSSQ